MGAPALDPAAGCLPAADLPWLFTEFLSLREHLLSPPGSRCPLLPSGGWFADSDPVLVRRLVAASKGRLPLSPVGSGDRKGPRVCADCSPRRRRLRRLGGGGLLPSHCQDLRWHRRYLLHSTSIGRPLVGQVRPSPGFCHPWFFCIKPLIPPLGLFCLRVVQDEGSGGGAEFAFSLQWENTFSACSSLASLLPSASGSPPQWMPSSLGAVSGRMRGCGGCAPSSASSCCCCCRCCCCCC